MYKALIPLIAIFCLAVVPSISWGQACTTGWSTAEDFTTDLIRPVGGYWDGKIYLTGGYTPLKAYVSAVHIYDLAGDSWTTGTGAVPTAGEAQCGGIADGKLFLFGGFDGVTDFNNTQIYDIAGDSWSAGEPMTVARWGCQAAAIDGTFYVAGGFESLGTYLDTHAAYDIAGDTWDDAVAQLPEAQAFGEGLSTGGLFYSITGKDSTGALATDVQVYDPGSDSWSAVADNGSGRYDPSVASDGFFIYTILGGGLGGNQWNPWTTSEVYDIAGDSWASFPSPATATLGHLTTFAPESGGLLFSVAGRDGAAIYSRTNNVYSLCSASPDSVAPDAGDEGVETAVTITGGGFEATDTAFLTDGAKADFDLTGLTVDSDTSISGTVPDTVPAGIYDLVVESVSGESGVLEDAFEVESAADDDDDVGDDDDATDDDDDDAADDDDDAADDDDDDDNDDDDSGGCCG
jgi:Kelch motif/Galactose oxidase, central domain